MTTPRDQVLRAIAVGVTGLLLSLPPVLASGEDELGIALASPAQQRDGDPSHRCQRDQDDDSVHDEHMQGQTLNLHELKCKGPRCQLAV